MSDNDNVEPPPPLPNGGGCGFFLFVVFAGALILWGAWEIWGVP